MRILHTSDWHVGVTLKGRARLDEQRAVFGQIVDIAREEGVDLVIVAGDLYDTASPSSAAQLAHVIPVIGSSTRVVATPYPAFSIRSTSWLSRTLVGSNTTVARSPA